MPTFLPDGDDLPPWLAELRKRHQAALDEYERAVGYAVDVEGQQEADNRAYRRAVRDALRAGQAPPPPPQAREVGELEVEIFVEEAGFAREQLATTACEILNEVRGHLNELDHDIFLRGASEFRFALARGPRGGDGLTEADRQRIARQKGDTRGIVDLTDPANASVGELGDQEVVTSAAA
jgi:hypothetical protein